MKTDRHGQASILNEIQYSKIRSQIKEQKYKLLLDIAWFTGERWGAVVQLKIQDCYNNDGTPRNYILFRARTRKASPSGKHQTREVFTHPTLKELLASYTPAGGSTWLFANDLKGKPITVRRGDQLLRDAVAKAGLAALGVSTHSTRRTFITKLWRNGTDLNTIKQITGHKDFKSLSRYIEVDTNRTEAAIAAL